MDAQECIDALDDALAADGEDVTLRRITGSTNNDVSCRAKVSAIRVEEIAAGIMQTDVNVIISPTQITDAGWPGGRITGSPPYDLDPRFPKVGSDKVIVQNRLRTVAFVDPVFVDNTLVRINMRVTG